MDTSLTSFAADANAGVWTEFNATDWSAFHSNAKSVPIVPTASSLDAAAVGPEAGWLSLLVLTYAKAGWLQPDAFRRGRRPVRCVAIRCGANVGTRQRGLNKCIDRTGDLGITYA